MKVIVQRVTKASCIIDNNIYSSIDNGMLLLVSFTHDDQIEDIKKMALKISKLRIFSDEVGKMNLDLNKVSGQILSISQFTLYADLKNSNRPSFTNSMKADMATKYYDTFNDELRIYFNDIKTGVFGADMKLDFINDGPVTIILDSKELFN